MQRNFLKQRNTGFTLLEMLVAVALFALVFVSVSGAIVTIITSYRKVTVDRVNIDNLSTAMESMVRNIKTGSIYHCGPTGDIATGQKCPGGQPDGLLDGDAYFSFLQAEGVVTDSTNFTVYSFLSCTNHPTEPWCGRLLRSDNGGMNYADGSNSFYPLTDTIDKLEITNLRFYVTGTDPFDPANPASDTAAPRIVVVMQGKVGTDARLKSFFSIQTTITQRIPDIVE